MKCPARDLLSRRPERLVVSGYRHMMAAYDLADASCWDAVWSLYINELGAGPARRTVGELQYWARTMRAEARRPLSSFPHCCLQLCHDECMALSLIAAGQSLDQEAGYLAAEFVTGSRNDQGLKNTWQAASHLAAALREADQIIHPVPCTVIRSIHTMQLASSRISLNHTLN